MRSALLLALALPAISAVKRVEVSVAPLHQSGPGANRTVTAATDLQAGGPASLRERALEALTGPGTMAAGSSEAAAPPEAAGKSPSKAPAFSSGAGGRSDRARAAAEQRRPEFREKIEVAMKAGDWNRVFDNRTASSGNYGGEEDLRFGRGDGTARGSALAAARNRELVDAAFAALPAPEGSFPEPAAATKPLGLAGLGAFAAGRVLTAPFLQLYQKARALFEEPWGGMHETGPHFDAFRDLAKRVAERAGIDPNSVEVKGERHTLSVEMMARNGRYYMVGISEEFISRVAVPELVALTAHEMAHVKNGDFALLTRIAPILVAQFSAGAIVAALAYTEALPLLWLFGGSVGAGVILLALGYGLLTGALRLSERAADAGGAWLTKPEWMASGLESVERILRGKGVKADDLQHGRTASRVKRLRRKSKG